MDINNFYKCEKKLTNQDVEDFERKLAITIPDALKNFYLICNGGMVYKDICKIESPPWQLQILNFIPIKYNKAFKNDSAFLLEGIALEYWSEGKLPKELLPFARDIDGDFICIDITTGFIYRYYKIKWDNTINKEQNFKQNSLYLFDSLEKFLNALQSEDIEITSDQEYSLEYIEPRKSNNYYNSEKKVSINDIDYVEKQLKIKIPSQLKDFILKQNGGIPENNVWIDKSDEYDYVSIQEFIPIKHYKIFDNDKNYLMNGIAEKLWSESILPKTLLPFAKDAGGNYFCISLTDGQIYYYTLDTWSDNLSLSENYNQSTRFLCNNFNKFISNLVCEDDL